MAAVIDRAVEGDGAAVISSCQFTLSKVNCRLDAHIEPWGALWCGRCVMHS